ncbi:hypothetical protein D3C83_213140 [compost metagenome]
MGLRQRRLDLAAEGGGAGTDDAGGNQRADEEFRFHGCVSDGFPRPLRAAMQTSVETQA